MSREKKFTPGPWVSVEADFAGGKHYGVSPLENLNCGVALTGLVGDGDDAASRASANLIAAAPELLKELESHCEACRQRNNFESCSGCFTRRAIKKAYGE